MKGEGSLGVLKQSFYYFIHKIKTLGPLILFFLLFILFHAHGSYTQSSSVQSVSSLLSPLFFEVHFD